MGLWLGAGGWCRVLRLGQCKQSCGRVQARPTRQILSRECSEEKVVVKEPAVTWWPGCRPDHRLSNGHVTPGCCSPLRFYESWRWWRKEAAGEPCLDFVIASTLSLLSMACKLQDAAVQGHIRNCFEGLVLSSSKANEGKQSFVLM